MYPQYFNMNRTISVGFSERMFFSTKNFTPFRGFEIHNFNPRSLTSLCSLIGLILIKKKQILVSNAKLENIQRYLLSRHVLGKQSVAKSLLSHISQITTFTQNLCRKNIILVTYNEYF